MLRRIYSILVLGLLAVDSAFAQNTGGIISPIVNEGGESIQYRTAFNSDTDNFAHRLHYQQSINGDVMWRVLGQTRETDDSNVDFDFLQAELFWEFSDESSNRRTGVRFDVRARDDNRPDQIGVNWMNLWLLKHGWSTRAVLLTTYQFGDNAADGIGLGSRGLLAKRFSNNHSIGVELFSTYGTTDNIQDFDDQSHSLGPMYSFPVGGNWSVFTGLLFGVTDASADSEVRFWLTKSI